MLKKIIILSFLYSLNIHAQIAPNGTITFDSTGCKKLQILDGLTVTLIPSKAIVDLEDVKLLDNQDHSQGIKQNNSLLLNRCKNGVDAFSVLCIKSFHDTGTSSLEHVVSVRDNEQIQCIVDNSLQEINMMGASKLGMKKKDWVSKTSKQNIALCVYACMYDGGSILSRLPMEMIYEILRYDTTWYYRLSNNFTINCFKKSNARLRNNFNNLTVDAWHKSRIVLKGTCENLQLELHKKAIVNALHLESTECVVSGEGMSRAVISCIKPGRLVAFGRLSAIVYYSNITAFCYGYVRRLKDRDIGEKC